MSSSWKARRRSSRTFLTASPSSGERGVNPPPGENPCFQQAMDTHGAVRKIRTSVRLKRELWVSRAQGIVHIVSRETMARLLYRSVAVQRRGAGVIVLPHKTKGRPPERPPEIYETGCIRLRLPVDAHGATDDGQRENGEPHMGHLLCF